MFVDGYDNILPYHRRAEVTYNVEHPALAGVGRGEGGGGYISTREVASRLITNNTRLTLTLVWTSVITVHFGGAQRVEHLAASDIPTPA